MGLPLSLRKAQTVCTGSGGAVSMAVHQASADMVLEQLGLAAQRWLGHVQALGGVAEMQFLRQGDEAPNPADLEHRFLLSRGKEQSGLRMRFRSGVCSLIITVRLPAVDHLRLCLPKKSSIMRLASGPALALNFSAGSPPLHAWPRPAMRATRSSSLRPTR